MPSNAWPLGLGQREENGYRVRVMPKDKPGIKSWDKKLTKHEATLLSKVSRTCGMGYTHLRPRLFNDLNNEFPAVAFILQYNQIQENKTSKIRIVSE